ncbi:hypothetical protein H4R18_000985 [Coemansia javaensis]|uniref:Cytochrome b5 heme-binding domain-containing protein n=1 Tax=Coemansia javaensis TaxID=2761396 RepID=A0A9W8LJV1_9FUNG|nr:hypothetical protein H4R18_000985 [Coemansia javaensis]
MSVPADSPPKTFVADEIATHNTRKDIWIVINGRVYDVTRFLEEHPGGEEVILEYAGRDATEAFEDIGHSDDARDMLKDFFIGNLKAPTAATQAGGDADADHAHLRTKQNSSSWGLLVPVAVAVAFVAYKLYA